MVVSPDGVLSKTKTSPASVVAPTSATAADMTSSSALSPSTFPVARIMPNLAVSSGVASCKVAECVAEIPDPEPK